MLYIRVSWCCGFECNGRNKKLSLNLTAEHYIGDEYFKDFVENFKVSLRISLRISSRISTRIYLFQQCREAVDQAKLRLCSHGTGPKWIRPYPGTDHFCSHGTVPLINVCLHGTGLVLFGTESK